MTSSRARTKAASAGSSLRHLRLATLFLFTGFAVLVAGSCTYYVAQQRTAALDSAVHAAEAARDAVQYQASQTFQETLRVVEGIADTYRADAANHRINESELHQMLVEKIAHVPGITTFTLVDAQHRGVAGGRTFPVDVGLLLTSGMSFDALIDIGDDLFVGQIYKNQLPNAAADSWYLPLGMSVHGTDGQDIGMVIALLNTTALRRYFTSLDVGAHGSLSVNAGDGRILAANQDEQRGVTIPALIQEFERLRTAPGHQLTTVVRGDGPLEGVITASSTVGPLPFFVSVTLDSRDFLAAWRATRLQIAIAGIATIFTATIFAAIILRQLHDSEDNETALRQAKAAAEEANEAKSRFLAHMSHEFRTPLNAIMGFSEIIKNKVLGDEVSAGYVTYAGHIHRSGQHLLHIINEILDMARIESGAQPLQSEAIDVRGVIMAAVAFTEGLAHEKGLSLRVALPEGLPWLSGDDRFTRQVLINLLSNAIKFSPPDSEIIVAARIGAGGLDISVTDHGPGIEDSILRRLGEPFLQGNPALSHSGQGTGLGLSICKRYMTLLGGALRIESALGSGTTATIHFPKALLIDPPATQSVA